MKILIDTNIFLDFYRTTSHTVDIFNILKENINSIVLTDQIIQEFERSRESILLQLKRKFISESSLDNFSSSFLQNLDNFQELTKIQKQYKFKQKEIISQIDKMILDSSADPIATYFSEFVNDAIRKETVYYTTDEIINRADKRKKIGNPPASNKYSIGDEINWEIILENVKEDLIIVGRDNTYTNNYTFIQKDFHKRTGKIIFALKESITEAMEIAGINTSEELKIEESNAIKELNHYNDYWKSNP